MSRLWVLTVRRMRVYIFRGWRAVGGGGGCWYWGVFSEAISGPVYLSFTASSGLEIIRTNTIGNCPPPPRTSCLLRHCILHNTMWNLAQSVSTNPAMPLYMSINALLAYLHPFVTFTLINSHPPTPHFQHRLVFLLPMVTQRRLACFVSMCTS